MVRMMPLLLMMLVVRMVARCLWVEVMWLARWSSIMLMLAHDLHLRDVAFTGLLGCLPLSGGPVLLSKNLQKALMLLGERTGSEI